MLLFGCWGVGLVGYLALRPLGFWTIWIMDCLVVMLLICWAILALAIWLQGYRALGLFGSWVTWLLLYLAENSLAVRLLDSWATWLYSWHVT